MSSPRKIEKIVEAVPVTEGAGVKLKRSLGTRDLDYLDPFLLFDHFGSDNPDDYVAGFPLHPHRGIETVTYMLAGVVNHRDSLGHAGSIGAGDVQWMTAGRGILHEEMPQLRGGKLDGFQLWVNLPAKFKMTPPRYQDIHSNQIPEIKTEDGVKIRVITGTVNGTSGPVKGIAANPIYLDITVPAKTSFTQDIEPEHSAFIYVFEGKAQFGRGTEISSPHLAVLGNGDSIQVKTDKAPVRFLLVSGKPLKETIARHGPFVMNTQEEIRETLRELQKGTFIQSPIGE